MWPPLPKTSIRVLSLNFVLFDLKILLRRFIVRMVRMRKGIILVIINFDRILKQNKLNHFYCSLHLNAKTFENAFFELVKGGKASFKLPISVI